MQQNDPGVKLLKDPTAWTESTAVTDAQNALNAYGGQLKAIYSQWSSPDTGILPLLKSKGYGKVGAANHIITVSDDGVAFEMCDIQQGTLDASQSQPADLYAKYALQYAVDAAKGVKLTRRPARRRRAHPAERLVQRRHQPRRPDRRALRHRHRAHPEPELAGRQPARRAHHHPGDRRQPVGQRLRRRARRRLLQRRELLTRRGFDREGFEHQRERGQRAH